MTKFRWVGWGCIALITLGCYFYFSGFEASHPIPAIEPLSPNVAHHDH